MAGDGVTNYVEPGRKRYGVSPILMVAKLRQVVMIDLPRKFGRTG
jgi:hypothetical protein